MQRRAEDRDGGFAVGRCGRRSNGAVGASIGSLYGGGHPNTILAFTANYGWGVGSITSMSLIGFGLGHPQASTRL